MAPRECISCGFFASIPFYATHAQFDSVRQSDDDRWRRRRRRNNLGHKLAKRKKGEKKEKNPFWREIADAWSENMKGRVQLPNCKHTGFFSIEHPRQRKKHNIVFTNTVLYIEKKWLILVSCPLYKIIYFDKTAYLYLGTWNRLTKANLIKLKRHVNEKRRTNGRVE